MNNLLFTALIIALLYYFFYYLPSQKKLSTTNPPSTKLTLSQFTQTEPNPINQDYQIKIEELKTKNQELERNYQTKIKTQQTQITQLQSEIRDLVKRPLKPTNSKGTQTDNKDLENTLDALIKDIQALNNEL